MILHPLPEYIVSLILKVNHKEKKVGGKRV